MTRTILAIACAIALASSAQAQVPASPPPLPPPPPLGGPGAFAPLNPFAQKFEYEFVIKPRGTDAFKKLLKERGKDGWEYVGLIPDGDELIFKKAQSEARPGLIGPPEIGGAGPAIPKLPPPPPPLPPPPPKQ